MTQDPFDVGPKSDVEHPVGFVQHDTSQFSYIERPPANVIKNATRCPDNNIRASLKLVNLGMHRLATVQAGDESTTAIGQLFDFRCDLHCQFACRCEHQRLRQQLVQINAFQDRYAERCGLASSRLSLPHQIEVFHRERNHRRLNWSGLGKTDFFERL